MKKVFLIISFLFVLFETAQALEDSQKIYSFAINLYNSQDYYGAVHEFERLLFYYPNSSLSEEASYMVGMGYMKGGQTLKAVASFEKFIDNYLASPKRELAMYDIGECYFRDEEYDAAVAEFSRFIKEGKNEETVDQAKYLLGWSYLHLYKWEDAKEAFKELGNSRSKYSSESIKIAEFIDLKGEIPQKSGSLSGFLSAIVPGAGQFYCNRVADAAVSFVLNATFIYLSGSGFSSGNTFMGTLFALFESGFYLGNIYGAVGAAEKFNKEAKEEFLNKIAERYRVKLQ